MHALTGIEADPFLESASRPQRWRTTVLGAPCEFTSNSRELLGVAQQAFAGVPRHRWTQAPHDPLRIALQLRTAEAPDWKVPPKPRLSAGAGLLCGHVDTNNFVIIDAGAGRALVQVDAAMLRHPRLMRYELIEFAAICLAVRVQGLISLHAGCVAVRGRGVLLLGSSGAGKSTLALHAALAGCAFLAEDSVFVYPGSLLATGLSAHVHAGETAGKLIKDPRLRRAVQRAPRIVRRSGVRKHELDLRRGLVRLAPRPVRIVATVLLTDRPARGAAALAPLSAARLKRELRREQAYAARRPGWDKFERDLLCAGGYRLDRVPPGQAVAVLRELLADKRR
jgi:hypothetical protein